MSIQLSISEMCQEIRHLRDAASDLLQPDAADILHSFEGALSHQIRWVPPGSELHWEISRDRPLLTKISRGEFCFNSKKGRHDCYARITSLWAITPVKPDKKGKQSRLFQVCGKASVHVQIFEATGKLIDSDKDPFLGSWRMELGDHDAPGCYFHTQILGEKDHTGPPFPHSLDVPRLPNFLITPMAAAEFVLSELFQDRWRSLERQTRPAIRGWAGIQRARLKNIFDWYLRKAEEAEGSPWTHIKSSLPEATLFV